ncbi:MAG: hypothetical protein IKN56_03170, partial [Clostridia bacterium]|nr:hypothetical protein [Clostridia bacterium]
MTPTGQIVFTQEMPVKKQTPLSDYIENWLLDKKKDLEIEQLTYEGYECICKNHLIPYFKRLELTVEGT